MTGESFEWAIKKDVRNNPIVREVDRERLREMWRSVSIGAFLVLVRLRNQAFALFATVEMSRSQSPDSRYSRSSLGVAGYFGAAPVATGSASMAARMVGIATNLMASA